MDGLGQYVHRLKRLQDSMTGAGAASILDAMGLGAKDDAGDAVRSDLGDLSMSHWRRGAPIDVVTRYQVVASDAVEVSPTPRARGPWRVLEEGRKAGGAFDLVQVGRVRRDGTRRGRSRGRNQGATRGKDTWSDAVRLMEANTAERVQQQHVKDIGQIFGG